MRRARRRPGDTGRALARAHAAARRPRRGAQVHPRHRQAGRLEPRSGRGTDGRRGVRRGRARLRPRAARSHRVGAARPLRRPRRRAQGRRRRAQPLPRRRSRTSFRSASSVAAPDQIANDHEVRPGHVRNEIAAMQRFVSDYGAKLGASVAVLLLLCRRLRRLARAQPRARLGHAPRGAAHRAAGARPRRAGRPGSASAPAGRATKTRSRRASPTPTPPTRSTRSARSPGRASARRRWSNLIERGEHSGPIAPRLGGAGGGRDRRGGQAGEAGMRPHAARGRGRGRGRGR